MRLLIIILFSFCLFAGCNNGQEAQYFAPPARFEPIHRLAQGRGELSDSSKIGLWNYNSDTISWSIFKDDSINIQLSHPLGWKVHTSSEYLFASSVPGKNEYLIVLKFNQDSISGGLIGYQRIAFSDAQSGLPDKSSLVNLSVKFIEFLEAKAFHTTYVFERKSETFVVFSLYVQIGHDIYDFTYKFPADTQMNRHEIIFWEFVRGLRVEGHQLLPDNKMAVIKVEKWKNEE